MQKLATICCLMFLIAMNGYANIKKDPTGAVSNGLSQPVLTVQDMSGLEFELSALYEEAYFLKQSGRDSREVWARITEINAQLNGRDGEVRLDEGGESCTSAFQINSLPFCDTGNTSDNVNDYVPPVDFRCGPDPGGDPVQGSGRDVVYVYTPTSDETVSVSLCGSQYDTYLHIYANGCPGSDNAVQVCCNDDHSGTCPAGSGNLTSCCANLQLSGGVTYYIIVDGWTATSGGNYQINVVNEDRCGPCPPQPCVFCPEDAYHSTEPVCFDGYVDMMNSGCVPGTPGFFEQVECNTTVCGTLGRHLTANGAPYDDSDYFIFNVTAAGESLVVRLQAESAGAWAMWRVNPENVCGDEAIQLFPTQLFERCQVRTFGACVQPGTYVLGLISQGPVPCGVPYRIDITCLDCPEPVGRCCYRTEAGAACMDEVTRGECAAVEGLWTPGLTCEECCPTDFCLDYIDVPGVYEYWNAANSCCSVPVDFCVGEDGCDDDNCFEANRAVIYRIVLEEDAIVSMSASGPGDNQLMIFTDCANPTGSCVASADNATDNEGSIYQGATEVLENVALAAGTYYVATSHFFWSNFPCGEIALTIISDTPLPVELMEFDLVAMDGAVKVMWTTASESNSSHFDILRDGQLANRIGAANSATGSQYSWTDENVENGRSYLYELVAVDLDGGQAVVASESAMPNVSSGIVSEFSLHQNYPNPFNPETVISFDLPMTANVELTVVNALGQEVAVLANGTLEAGRHEVKFDGTSLPSGLYFYRLTAGSYHELRKMVLLK